MRKPRLPLSFLLLVLCLAVPIVPAGASWEGVHSFSVAVQGSVSTMDRLASTSYSVPVDFRATISVTVDRPTAAGDYTGRMRITEASVRQDGEPVNVPVSSAGYRILLRPQGPHEVLDDVSDLGAYGIDLNEILNLLFPVPQGQRIEEGASWSVEYTQSVQVGDIALSLPTRHTFNVNEVRDSLAAVQSSLRGETSADLQPGRVSVTQVGAGAIHIDPATGHLVRSALTVRSTIERSVPFGALAPQEHSVLAALVTTSVERLAAAPAPIPWLGPAYDDPAGRFSLRLPEGWDPQPIGLDHSMTIFSNQEQTELLFVEIQEAPAAQTAMELAEGMLARYAAALVDFTLLTPPEERSWHGVPAAFTAYRYHDGVPVEEAALYTHVDGYNVALQYAVHGEAARQDGEQLLELLAEHFELGPTPAGRVDTEQLILSPTVLYESEALALEIEMPLLWPLVRSDDTLIAFMELGGAGQLTIHLESVSPEESPLALMSQWTNRLVADNPNARVVSAPRQDALGPLSGASAVIDWTLEDRVVRQKVVGANFDGILYVAVVQYDQEGYEARQAAFERMLSSFSPRLDYIVAHLTTFNAYDPPPPPEGDKPYLLIGRLLHEYTAEDGVRQAPAAEVRVQLSAGDMSYVAITDSDGFFYAANLPVEAGATITIEGIRGWLFDLPFDVHLPLRIALSVHEQVGFVGELVLVLNPDGETVSLRSETGYDEQTGTSRVHQAFLSRYPDSPWSELVRQDLAQRLSE